MFPNHAWLSRSQVTRCTSNSFAKMLKTGTYPPPGPPLEPKRPPRPRPLSPLEMQIWTWFYGSNRHLTDPVLSNWLLTIALNLPTPAGTPRRLTLLPIPNDTQLHLHDNLLSLDRGCSARAWWHPLISTPETGVQPASPLLGPNPSQARSPATAGLQTTLP
jgi:hypothetical protein